MMKCDEGFLNTRAAILWQSSGSRRRLLSDEWAGSMWTAGVPLGKEVTRVPGGTAQDLVSLLGMAHSLKLTNRLFLEFSISHFWTTVDHR